MRHVFIINPAAGRNGRVELLKERIRAAFPQGDSQVVYTAGAGDARRLAEEALAQGGPVRLYACGGDGTLNEVVNAAAGHDQAAVTNVPMGTGNDFLRIFGRKARTRFLDIEALKAGPQAALDLMDCNGFLGLDVACAGVDARVAVGVHRFKGLPLVGKKLAYILSLVVEVARGVNRPMTVEMGPIRYSGPTALCCVCNGRFYGGGFCPVPEAMPDDGVLDMILVGELSLLELVRYVGKYARGRYKECPETLRHHHGQEARISSPVEMALVVDGEALWGKEFTLRLARQKVNFFYPAGLTW